jgi:hypothetical protein
MSSECRSALKSLRKSRERPEFWTTATPQYPVPVASSPAKQMIAASMPLVFD